MKAYWILDPGPVLDLAHFLGDLDPVQGLPAREIRRHLQLWECFHDVSDWTTNSARWVRLVN